jgi:hypothetical protein
MRAAFQLFSQHRVGLPTESAYRMARMFYTII